MSKYWVGTTTFLPVIALNIVRWAHAPVPPSLVPTGLKIKKSAVHGVPVSPFARNFDETTGPIIL